MLLLLLAGTQPGDSVLDPFGGSGTIAIEAALQFERVTSVTSDKHRPTLRAAISNVVRARPHLAAGSMLSAEDWDARNLSAVANGSIDRYVADLPFGHRCRWDVAAELPSVLTEVRRVLRPNSGRCVLLMKGYRRLEQLVADMNGNEGEDINSTSTAFKSMGLQDEDRTLVVEHRRPVGIGGFMSYAITLKVD